MELLMAAMALDVSFRARKRSPWMYDGRRLSRPLLLRPATDAKASARAASSLVSPAAARERAACARLHARARANPDGPSTLTRQVALESNRIAASRYRPASNSVCASGRT